MYNDKTYVHISHVFAIDLLSSHFSTQHTHMASRRQLKMEWNAPECNSSKGGDSRLLKDCTAWLPSFLKSCVVCHQHRHHRTHRRSRAWWHFRKPLVLIRFRWSIEERSRRSGAAIRCRRRRAAWSWMQNQNTWKPSADSVKSTLL